MLVPFYDVYASCGLPTEQGDIPPEMIKVPGGDFDGLNTYSISVKGEYYKNYHRAGEAILEKLTECSQKLPQSSHINSSSH